MIQPLVRANPWYPGQLGIRGSDNTLGLRERSTGVVLYVDRNSPLANDASDGTNPQGPLLTIQGAVTKLIAMHAIEDMRGSVIVVNPGTYTETVTVPFTGCPPSCAIVGAGTGALRPTWTSAAAGADALTLGATGWEISNIYFIGPALASCIRVCWLLPVVSYRANLTYIHDCFFDGAFTGIRGIALHGAPGDVTIEHNVFKEFHVAGNTARAIAVTNTADACPLECRIVGNIFSENDNHITPINGVGSFNASFFLGNIFNNGGMLPTFQYIDLRLGGLGRNVLSGNTFCGDYSNVGGYFDGAVPSCWVGNYCEDIAEAECGPDGLTIAPPAA
jgi:hypothetical protein